MNHKNSQENCFIAASLLEKKPIILISPLNSSLLNIEKSIYAQPANLAFVMASVQKHLSTIGNILCLNESNKTTFVSIFPTAQ